MKLKPDPKSDNLTTKPKRVPIPLSPDEIAKLTKLAEKESRSWSAMAGIIYRIGMKAYAKGTRCQQ